MPAPRRSPFRAPEHWRLSTRVLVAGFLLLAVLLVIVVAANDEAIDERRSSEFDNAVDTAEAVAGIVDGFARDLEATILAAALLLGTHEGPITQESAGPNLQRLTAEFGQLRSIFVTDLDGVVLASADGNGLGAALGERPYLRSLIEGAPQAWGPTVLGIESGEITVTYGRVILDRQGAPLGFAIVAFYPPQLAERLQGRIPADADVTIIDAAGTVMYSMQHGADQPDSLDLSADPDVQAALAGQTVRLEGSRGLFQGDGERFGAIVPIPTTGWSVAYTRPLAPLNELLQDRLLTQAALVTGAVLVIAVLLVITTRRITSPLAQLADAAGAVARGQHPVLPEPTGGYEVSQLTRAVQVMSDAVREREEALRQESERRNTLAEASRAFTEAIADLDAETVTVARIVAGSLGDGCVVFLARPDTGALYAASVYHASPELLTRVRAAMNVKDISLVNSPLADVMRTGEPFFLRDTNAEAFFSLLHASRLPHLAGIELASFASVPLRMHGEIVGVLSVWRDREQYTADDVRLLQEIADRAALGIENARLFRESGERAHALELAMQAQEEFLSLVSHDIRNPLASISAAAQLIRRRGERRGAVTPEEIESSIQLIEDAVTKASREIEAFLDLARARTRPVEMQRMAINLVDMVDRLAGEHQRMSARHHLVVEHQEPELIGEWDVPRLERVLDNLLSNAVKYSPGGGEIRVSTAREEVGNEDWAVVRVQDHGVGIPEEAIPHLFERFYRAENAANLVSGTGLGLSSVALIVQAHGGEILVESSLGSGSVFTMRLPCSVHRVESPPATAAEGAAFPTP